LGGGGLLALSQTVIGDLVSPRERPRYQILFATVFATANLAGPVFGGVFAEHAHYSLIFWINVPLGLTAIWMTNAKLKRLPAHHRPHRLDLAGAALLTLAGLAAMLALTWGGHRYSWAAPQVIGLLIGSAILWALFAVRLRTAAEPLIPTELLKNPIVATATLAGALTQAAQVGLAIYLPVYFETVLHLSASQSGLALIPLMLGATTGSAITGRAMATVQHYKRIPVVGLLVATASVLALAVEPRSLPPLAVVVLLSTTALGLGSIFSVTSVSVQNAVPLHQLGTALANMFFIRQLASAAAVAVFGAILLAGGVAAQINRLAPAGSATVATADPGRPFRWVFLASALLFIVAWAILLMMKELPLSDRISEPTAPPP
jgi:MFS family permease